MPVHHERKPNVTTKKAHPDTLHPLLRPDVPTGVTTMRGLAYKRLREAILVGDLRPGQRLIEEHVAGSLEISRTPLREAIQMLEKEGLLRRLPQGGVQVREASVDEIRELNAVRVALECLAVEAVCRRVRSGSLATDELHRLVDLDVVFIRAERAHERNDVAAMLELGYEFHRTLHELAENRFAAGLLEQTIGRMERYRALVPPVRNLAAVEEHRAITAAILDGDAATAVQLMRRHLESAGDLYQDAVRDLLAEGES